MTYPWAGTAFKASPEELKAVARSLDVDPILLQAIWIKESSGSGFTADGAVKWRFEPHKLPQEIQTQIGGTWTWRTSLGLDRLPGARRKLFWAAYAVDPEATMMASSWGGFQIMGFHATSIGYGTAQKMVQEFAKGEAFQLIGLSNFLKKQPKALAALRAKDIPGFTRYFNGSANVVAYSTDLIRIIAKLGGDRPQEVLARGSKGPSVKVLQRALGVTEDSDYGLETEKAVKKLQTEKGLRIDGVVGTRTWEVIDETPRLQEDTFDLLARRVSQGATAAGTVLSIGSNALPDVSPWVKDTLVMSGVGVMLLGALAWFIIRTVRAPA
jgi:hypothetical protein